MKAVNAATDEEHTDRQALFTSVGDDTYHRVDAAKAATQAPHAHTPVLVKCACWQRSVINLIDDSASHALLRVASEIADVSLNRSFHILLKNVSRKAGTTSESHDRGALSE